MLYAFDGTWNLDKPGTEHDTNVVWFRDAYVGLPPFYREGIGTRFDVVGKIVGGVFGAGGKQRVKEALEHFRAHQPPGEPIAVVGFSRGAALALHFVNQLAKKFSPRPPVKFVGLWDTVPAVGIAATKIDDELFWDLDLPANVERCFHAMALDERRLDFRIHHPDPSGPNQLVEVWFRGVHSDVGGGNENSALSSIALNWMFECAARTGIALRPDVVAKHLARMNPDAQISVHDLSKTEIADRHPKATDLVHESVTPRADTAQRNHVNPPVGTPVVNNRGEVTGKFDVRPATA